MAVHVDVLSQIGTILIPPSIRSQTHTGAILRLRHPNGQLATKGGGPESGGPRATRATQGRVSAEQTQLSWFAGLGRSARDDLLPMFDVGGRWNR